MTGKNILICPLDWGIGHATRCIPIIRQLSEAGANVILAADNRPYALLEREFNQLEIIRFPSYSVEYPENGEMAISMIRQSPQIIKNIFNEHRVLQNIIKKHQIDLVISDSRFGLWSRSVPSVYMTHQLMVKFPGRMKRLESLFNKLHCNLIRRYSECWILDFRGEPNLSGDLSHKYPEPGNSIFIGPLSRFTQQESSEKLYDLLVILSGPEPQRTIFEKVVIDQIGKYPSLIALILQGKSEARTEKHIFDSIRIISHLDSARLNEAMLASDLVLARPGYSTIMDLAVLSKKAILVPTPGQSEQEYLALKHHRENRYYSESQETFDLERSFTMALGYEGLEIGDIDGKVVVERVENLLRKR